MNPGMHPLKIVLNYYHDSDSVICLGSCHVMIGFAKLSVKGAVTEGPRRDLLGLGRGSGASKIRFC